MSNGPKGFTKHPGARPALFNDPLFMTACDLAGLPKTHRQWRKWARGFGGAFKFRQEARVALGPGLAYRSPK